MNIRLRFTAQLKDQAGTETDQIQISDEMRLKELIDLLVLRYGEGFKQILFNHEGVYRNSNLIAINMEQVSYQDNNQLNEGDELTLISPVSGG